ncbi:NAD(P)/FAD-dependent oxidoreductase [Aestuariispira insulae]|uniref:Gamma-glutamylputrescine oxidase n=1 Tax=Aestuariispira insulae TaxID=1461337 RepID=A0A3D9HKG4_9PROT|nr:FAD-binding oxidoreductase [Aestuariispira insulae]RED49963.1 gamma-glutamylputrescine oxidase [Aestuariispira insulae]
MTHPQHTGSYYAATAIGDHERPRLKGEKNVDICVIGGGFTGLSSALHLAEKGYSVVLLEGQRLGWGASGRNGGLVCTGQRKDQAELEELVGMEDARLLWDYSEEAKRVQKALIDKYQIPCDYKPGILTCAYKKSHVPELAEHAEHLNKHYGYDQIRAVDDAEMHEMLATPLYYGGCIDMGAAHLHPLNYALGLAGAAEQAGAELFEDSQVLSLDRSANGNVAKTAEGVVKSKYVVVACNGYLGKLVPEIAPSIMPINNFMVATESLGEEGARALIRDDVAIDATKFVVDYYRCSADHRLLFGGGENYSSNFPADIKGFVRKYMLDVFPQLKDVKLEYGWGGTLSITMNRMPAFGRLDHGLFYAQGFSGQGVLLTTMAGKVIAEAVSGTAERFDVFARVPTRNFPGGTLLRYPGLVAGMLYYSMLDKLGN